MKVVFEKTKAMNDTPLSYCPGCGHGIVQRIIGECLEELEIMGRTVGVLGVGCSAPSWQCTAYDQLAVPHGRPGAAATGLKRCNPNKIVFTYQGDGDIGSIGLAETMYAAVRSENITVICINNTVYAMTGGQMAPTTLEGQVTITSPLGRDTDLTGDPLHLPELIAQIPRARYVERVALYDTANIRRTKRAIKRALKNQVDGVGYSLVEVLSPCPSIWHMPPVDCMAHMEQVVLKEFPLGVFKDA